MSDLTNTLPMTNYANLLTLNNVQNNGLNLTLEAVQDGIGKSCPLELSPTQVNINYSVGQFLLNGVPLTASAASLNNAAQNVIPSGDTASRPVSPSVPPGTVSLFFNTDTNTIQAFNGTVWIN